MNKKRIIASLITVVATAALMAGATFAYFSSSASNTGNTFGSGTLILDVNKFGSEAPTPAFTVSNAAPGYTETQFIKLKNTGTIAAASTKLLSIETGTTPNLGDVLTLTLYNDVDNDATFSAPDTLIGTGHLNDSVWTNLSLGFGLTAGGSHNIIAVITFDSTAGDSYQDKSVSFNFNFQADQ